MAFPVVEGVAESAVATAGTSHAVTLPASIASSDLVLIIMDIGSTAATLNALTDWGEILDENAANGLKILRYTGAGVPSTPTFTSSAATRSASIAYRISLADKTVTPQIGTTATGTSVTPDPPSVTPTGGVSKPYLFIAFFGMAGEEADDDTWANTPPTNYTPSPPRQKTCGTAGTNLGGLIASAERALMTGSAEDPGTFNVDVSAAWRAQTIIVHPLALTGTAAWTDDDDTLAASGTAGSGGTPPTVTSRGFNDSGTTDVASVSLSAFTPAADELLIVAAAVEENTGAGSAASVIDTPTGLPAGASAFTAIGTDAESSTSFQDAAGAWYSQLGPTPASTTIVQAGTNEAVNAWIALAAVTVSGHNTTTPLAQAAIKDVEYDGAGAAPALSVAFGSGLTVDNVVIAAVAQSVDATETGAPTPTIGGQAMTAVATNGANQYMQVGIFKRVIDGSESGSTVAVTATGGSTRYMHIVFAAEIAAAPAGGGGVDGTAAWTEDADVLASAGTITRTGTSSWTEDADVLAASGAAGIAAAAWTEDADTLAAAGTITHTGTSSWTEDADTLASSGKITRVATIAWTEDADTLAASDQSWPAAISGNDRYIVDQVGNPWFMVGDAAWGLIANVTYADAQAYLDAVAAYGINTVMVSLIEGFYSNNPDGNVAGNPAYSGTMFQSTPGAAYWTHADAVIDYAETLGITVLAFPAYLGYGTDGLAAEVNAASNAQMTAYGEFLGQRYASQPNIIWCAGGDRGDNLTATDLARTDAMMTGIRTYASHLMTAHGQDLTTADGVYGAYSWLDLNNAYNAARDPLATTRTSYTDAPTRPTFFIEGQYEQDPQRSPVLVNGALMLRTQAWAPQLAGSVGHVYGNDPRWYFGDTWGGPYGGGTWQESLDHPAGNRDVGTIHLGYFASFWLDQGVQWWELVPDTTDTFLTAGEGSGETQASAAFNATDAVAVVYAPSNVSITVDLTELSAAATVRIRRYDPTAGTFTTVGTYATSGSQTITHPGNNTWGHSDWVYLIESTGGASGTAAWTEDADTVAAAGTVTHTATAAWTEDADVLAAAATVTHTGTAAWTEADDTATAAGYLPNDGPAAWTEDADSLSAAGKVGHVAAAAWSEDADTFSAAGKITRTGTSAWTEDADVLAASGASGTDLTGTAAWTEADDTLTSAGKVTRTGTAAWTDDADTITVAGIVGHSGTAAWVETDDTLAATGTATHVATIAWTEDADTLTAVAGGGRIGIAAWTEDADVFAAYAGILGPVITGTLTTTAVDVARTTTAADSDRTTAKVDR
jgi:hypothetical protein